MKIAIPVAAGKLALHFGHCEKFVLVDVQEDSKEILGSTVLAAPPHQPGLLPPWLAEQGATVILSGGMGMRAQQLFDQAGIQVVVGCPALEPEKVVQGYLGGTLEPGDNICDH